MNRRGYFLIVLGLLGVAGWAKVAGESIYDEKADARRQVAAAIAEASHSGKNIVLIFGANW